VRRRVLPFLLVLLALALPACGAGGGGLPGGGSGSGDGGGGDGTGTVPSANEASLAQQVLALVNQERASAGLSPVAWHAPAGQVAFEHSVDMDVRSFFSHVNPDGDGPSDRIDAAGISWSRLGENIAMGYPTPEDVMDGWMTSSGHRANILNPDFTHLGVGVRENGGGGPWWTQNFVTP
jgi:uncharacterized protein YkwD